MTKTCGECKHYFAEFYHCQKNDVMAEAFNTCEDFEAKIITNGDRIRMMSNEELATWGMYDLGTCPTFEKRQTCPKRGECSASEVEDCWRDWLNAPAESEGKMSKEYEYEWEKHTCGECTQFGDNRSCLCSRMAAEHKACASFKSPPTLFDQITQSPEVLAERLVVLVAFFRYNGEVKWFWQSNIANGKWEKKSEAIAATVAKLKEVAK